MLNHVQSIDDTYNLGFFFGPGFPLGFGMLSASPIAEAERFVPGLGPGTPLRLASEIMGVVGSISLSCFGADISACSLWVSCRDSVSLGLKVGVLVDVRASFARETLRPGVSMAGNRDRSDDGR